MLFKIDEAYLKRRSLAPSSPSSSTTTTTTTITQKTANGKSLHPPTSLSVPASSSPRTIDNTSSRLLSSDSDESSISFPLFGVTGPSPLAASIVSLFTSVKSLMSSFQGVYVPPPLPPSAASAQSHTPPTLAASATQTIMSIPPKMPVSTSQIALDPSGCSCFQKLGKREQLANVLTHLPWTFACIYGCWFLTNVSRTQDQLVCALIYGISFACAFGTSTIYHWCSYAGLCKGIVTVMQKLDRSLIYIVVAASFTPWLMLRDFEPASVALVCHILVWGLAIVGILYEQFTPVQYKTFENLCYIVQIFLPLMCIFFLRDASGLHEIFYGGLIYILGFWFFKMDGVIPFAHAMWHVCCNVGSFIHFYTISKYLFATTIA